MAAEHTCESRAFGKRTPGCPRCDELNAQGPAINIRRTTHGMSRRPIYQVWHAMIARCDKPSTKNYRYYGARGISVCMRWHKFEAFLADMGEAPAGMSLDRYPDQNGNYAPGNCRWATPSQQNRNLRSNIWVTLAGQRLVFTDACKQLGIKRQSAEGAQKHHGFSAQQVIDHYATGAGTRMQRRIKNSAQQGVA